MVDMMILRSVSILTSSEPFSRPDLRSCVPGYSALLSNTTVWQEGSDADMEAGYVVVGNCLHALMIHLFSYLLSTVRGLSSLHELNQVSKDRSVIVRARIEASCTETIVMNFLRD